MKTRIRKIAIAAITLAMTGFTACNNPLESFVERNIDISIAKSDNVVQLVGAGKLKFSHTRYFTAHRTECDRQICGMHEEYRCRDRERCTRDGARPGEPPCDPRRDRVCRPRCETFRECGYENVPIFCDVNCRQVPYTDSHTTEQESPINIVLKSSGQGRLDSKSIKNLILGVKTNDTYRRAFDDFSLRPKKHADLFDSLAKDDKTVLVLKAKGLRLKKQELMKLPEGFQAGESITLSIEIEPTGSSKTEYSAIGTPVDFPDLHTRSQE